MTHFFKILICLFILVSCASHNPKMSSGQSENCQSSDVTVRSIAAAGKCEDLFKPRIKLQVVENKTSKKDKKLHEATLELMTDVAKRRY